ncbi:MAG: FAD:protein FMN transferase [Algibacter sp.]
MKKISLFIFCIILCSCKQRSNKVEALILKNTRLEGSVFGTFYQVTYDSENNYEKQLDSLFYVINKSMSTYQTNSDISKLNRNESHVVDAHFINVFETSKDIYNKTEGAFDPTIGAVVNAWDFGPEGKIVDLDSLKINNLMASVGLNKVSLIQDKINKPQSAFLDFNAIAKGYGVDVVGRYLESQNIKNYLINIGGELRARGVNVSSDNLWTVGVENPNFNGSQSINKIIFLKDKAMATSGTYRKFKLDENGNRYAHIIDTKTGYPSKTNLLSISVIADDCMIADAYATAFQAMGIEKVKAFLKSHPELKVFLIFENEKKEFETLSLNGFPEN